MLRPTVLRASFFFVSITMVGCTISPSTPDTGLRDAGRDGGARDANLALDAPSMIDSGVPDAGLLDGGNADAPTEDDAGLDGGMDAGSDAGTDTGTDAGGDAGGDAGAALPGVLNETDQAAEADYCVVQFPLTTTSTSGVATELIFGQIFEAGRTDVMVGGAASGIRAELGFGPIGSDPRTSALWTFQPASFNVEVGNNDEYRSTLVVAPPGTYAYAYRFSFDGGANVTYCDTDGAGSNPGLTFSASLLGSLTVD
jgi:hypothetical protein